ncbi:hypothetical protein ACH42_11220 [Endozoicomonas sp. (ex Bugula neritina AB1)]|nr:hypothetical protein ACH42_11220 [Endozoicomonas sp. (ex Bugula neritina AB1)]
MDATLETRLHEGIDHLRTLLLDDPEQVAPADLSVVTDALRQSQSKKTADSIRPDAPVIPASSFNTANVLSEPLVAEPEVSGGSSFSFKPDANANSTLGAWDALGV